MGNFLQESVKKNASPKISFVLTKVTEPTIMSIILLNLILGLIIETTFCRNTTSLFKNYCFMEMMKGIWI